MRPDVRIATDDVNFKFRVGGLIINDGKVLVVEMNDNGHYCLPGGHVELGEDTKEASVREMSEELGYPVTNPKLICIMESFFIGQKNQKKYHELGYYYVVEAVNSNDINTQDHILMETDKNQTVKLDFKWIKLEDVSKTDFRPKILGEKISNKNFTLEHFIVKD